MDSNSQTIHNLIGEFEMKYWDKFGDFAMNIYAFVFSMIVGTIVAYSDMWGKE